MYGKQVEAKSTNQDDPARTDPYGKGYTALTLVSTGRKMWLIGKLIETDAPPEVRMITARSS
jgi:hypothetical protein